MFLFIQDQAKGNLKITATIKEVTELSKREHTSIYNSTIKGLQEDLKRGRKRLVHLVKTSIR